MAICYLNDLGLPASWHVTLMCADKEVTDVADSGAEVCLMSERIYEEFILAGLHTMELTSEGAILITALGTRSKRIKKQVLLHFTLGTDSFEQNFLVCSQLIGPVILGANFFNEYGIVLDFKEQCLCYDMGGEVRKRPFEKFQETNSEAANTGFAKDCVVRRTGHTNVTPPLEDTPRASCSIPVYLQEVCEVRREISNYDNALSGSYEDRESMSNVDLYCKIMKKGIGKGKRTLMSEDALSLSDDENDNVDENDNNDVKLNENAKGTGSDYDEMQSRQMNGARMDSLKPVSPDPRCMTAEGVVSLIEENENLTSNEKRQLVQLLLKYLNNLTTKPGICKSFEYKFEVNSSAPIVGHSRPIPFSLRPLVRRQITLETLCLTQT